MSGTVTPAIGEELVGILFITEDKYIGKMLIAANE
jgi:hypothetical protein